MICVYKVLSNKKISSNSYEMKIKADMVVKKCLPGQFVIVMGYEGSERIPLTIYDYDREKGIVSVIYQVVGASTLELTTVKDEIFGIVGPLGNPNEICLNVDEYKDKKGRQNFSRKDAIPQKKETKKKDKKEEKKEEK